MGVPWNFKNRINEVYGILTVIGPHEVRGTNTYWNCKCKCGNELFIASSSLTSNRTRSCGCKRGLAPNRYKPLDRISLIALKNMKARCYNEKDPDYKYYGVRGIRICSEWLLDSYSFYKWFDQNREANKSIDRKNNDGHYSPSNCKFSTPSEQCINRRLWTKNA